jgi:hypothetical protein
MEGVAVGLGGFSLVSQDKIVVVFVCLQEKAADAAGRAGDEKFAFHWVGFPE